MLEHISCPSLSNLKLVHAASGLTLEEPITESLTGAIQKINVSLT